MLLRSLPDLAQSTAEFQSWFQSKWGRENCIIWGRARQAEFEQLEGDVERAQQALEDRKIVERAKGLLMSALDLSEQDAFRRLQLTARERNLRLVEVAARIVEQQSLLAPKRKPARSR